MFSAESVAEYLGQRLQSPIKIANFGQLSGGACQDNYALDLQVASGADAGTYNLVLRTDKGSSLYSSLTRRDEYAILELACQASVQTPRPFWLETDATKLGHPFYFMERLPGIASSRELLKSKEFASARQKLPGELAENLSRIHGIKAAELPDELRARLGQPETSYARKAAQALRFELDRLPGSYPALELALNWLESGAPELDEAVLVHGDFRTGNFLVTENGLSGILDWEFAHLGDRHEDIAWLCLRDWRFGKNNLEAGGFALRSDFYREYERTSGFPVNPERVLFWEVMGNARWAAGAAGQAERHLSGGDTGIELAAIGRRVCEMEYEMLRLIENAG